MVHDPMMSYYHLNIGNIPSYYCCFGTSQAPDGFMGTYEEVLAHEKELGIVSGDELDMGGTGSYATEDVQLYEAPDGFRGTYEEVVAYEAEHGFDKGDEHAVKVKPEGIEVYSVKFVVLSV